jgi:hypothetical protein
VQKPAVSGFALFGSRSEYLIAQLDQGGIVIFGDGSNVCSVFLRTFEDLHSSHLSWMEWSSVKREDLRIVQHQRLLSPTHDQQAPHLIGRAISLTRSEIAEELPTLSHGYLGGGVVPPRR